MQQIPFDYKKFRAETLLKYNQELDETSASILFILQDEQRTAFAEQRSLINAASKKINDSRRILALDNDNPRWQAFWFGMGYGGMALIIAILIAGGFWVYYTYEEKQQEKLPVLNQWYKDYYDKTQNLPKKAVAEYLRNNPVP